MALNPEFSMACRIRSDFKLYELFNRIVEKPHRIDIQMKDFNRYYFHNSKTRECLGVTTDNHSGAVLFTELCTRATIFSTFWLDGQPSYETIHVGSKKKPRPGSIPASSFSLDSPTPAISGPYSSLTEHRKTQLRLELGDVHFPSLEYRKLERAAVIQLNGVADPSRGVWSILSVDGEDHKFKVVEPIFFFMDQADRTVSYSMDDVYTSRAQWLVSNLETPPNVSKTTHKEI